VPEQPFHPTSAAVRVNAMWVSALVVSLVSALLGILVKSWLREFGNRGLTSPRDSVRMRQFRYSGLVAWRLPEIVASLPLLLQLALVLFLVGLIDLLWTINTPVAALTTAIVSSSLLITFASLIIPFFRPSCPYKSPLALQIRHVSHGASLFMKRLSGYRPQSTDSLFKTWWEHDWRAVVAKAERATRNLDHSALEWSHKHLLDDDFLDSVAPCVSELAPGTRANFVFELVANAIESTSWKLLRLLRQEVEKSTTLELLQRELLRSGHRANARMLRMVLDVLPDALPDLRPVTTITTTGSERFSLMNGLPGIWVDDSVLRTSDMLSILHPLLSAYVLTGYSNGQAKSPLIQRVFQDLIELVYSRPQQVSTLEKVFHLLHSFSHIFRSYVRPDGEHGLFCRRYPLIQGQM
jgi:hypothetical protein